MRGKSARDLSEAEIREIALRYLCRREYGIEELLRKLLQRDADVQIARKVVGDLADSDLVSDQRFTEMYVRMRIRNLFGPLKIRAELQARGITPQQIAIAMPQDQDTWFENASLWAQKRCQGELDYAARAKIHRSLMNRGFTHEQANVALDRVQAQSADPSM